MEIQQNENESFTGYIHHFKREAIRCNFTNSATTIRIFIKGLRNAQTLAAQVYEKGPEAAQQLTATLIPSLTVNVMSHEADHCFQCEELGHILHCPKVRCFEYDEYGHIVVDCPHGIPPSGTPAHHHRLKSHTRHHTRSTSHHHHQNRYRHSRSRSQSKPCRYCSHSYHDSYRCCPRSHHTDNRHHHRSTS